MKFIALKTNDGTETGKNAFYCRVLEVTRQGFYDYLKNRDKPWKYEALAAEMMEIIDEDECNDTYGRKRMYQALLLKHSEAESIPSESTIYRVMREIGITHRPRRKPNSITKAELCVETVKSAIKSYPDLRGAILHSDRGSQYTSEKYREALKHAGFVQSMNSAGGRCHDNARCESMWARMKEELFYSRNRRPEDYTVAELKTMIWRYYMSYWNNRRICSSNGELPPAVKRKRYYESRTIAA